MMSTANTQAGATVWQVNPTTADLIAETNKITVSVSGLPQGLLPHQVAEKLRSLRLPLTPLAAGKSITQGEDAKEIRLLDGRLLCSSKSDTHGRTELRFTELLAELLPSHQAP